MAGGPVNACAGNNCSGTNNPNLQLTVTGASGSVTWCGETWNLPADSGDTRCVCPTTWTETINYVSANYYKATNKWEYTNVNTTNMIIGRYAYTTGFPIGGAFANYISAFNRALWNLRSGPKTNFGVNAQNVPAGFTDIDTVAYPTKSAYAITNDFFTSVTNGGITYTWAKGINWP
jgi:hypothetical protein